MMADQAGNVGIVFNDEKTGFHGSIVNGKQLSDARCQRSMSGSGANFIGL
jgi:hypothetical protein